MKPKLVAKLDIKIEQDWDLVRNIAFSESSSAMKKSFDAKDVMTEQYSDDYSISYQGHLSNSWTIHSGDLLKQQLPWYENFLKIVKPLQYDGVGFNRTKSSIDEHFDFLACYSDSGEDHVLEPEGQCKINFVIGAEDSNTITILTDRDDPTNVKSYGAEPGIAWLVDINHPHRVACNGYREVISFKFCEKFETVLEHFKALGPLTLK
jgi:hypothetical protein